MTLYYYMYRSWQDCCRRGENRSWPSVSIESVDSEYWCLNKALVYAFIMRLTVEERVLRSTFKLNTLYKPEATSLKETLSGTPYVSVDGYPKEVVGLFFRMFVRLIPAHYFFVRMLHVAENELWIIVHSEVVPRFDVCLYFKPQKIYTEI